MTVSAHKFHGPCGIGALVLRHGVSLRPMLLGGHQQAGLRPGTESVALAVGMHRALANWHGDAQRRRARMQQHRDALQQQLLAADIGCVVHGAAPRLPHTLNISFPGVDRQALLMALDGAGLCCSTGAACASGSSDPSPVLLAMGCSAELVASSLRLSLNAFQQPEEIRRGGDLIVRCVRQLRAQKGSSARAKVAREMP